MFQNTAKWQGKPTTGITYSKILNKLHEVNMVQKRHPSIFNDFTLNIPTHFLSVYFQLKSHCLPNYAYRLLNKQQYCAKFNLSKHLQQN